MGESGAEMGTVRCVKKFGNAPALEGTRAVYNTGAVAKLSGSPVTGPIFSTCKPD